MLRGKNAQTQPASNAAQTPSYMQSFRDYFFKHVEDGFIYAYAVRQAYKFDLKLQLIETQPCKFDASHFGANWYPAMPLQHAFFGIYEKRLYAIKDFNIQSLADAPQVSGFGYSYIGDQFILAYDHSIGTWMIYDVTGKHFNGKWATIPSVWNRTKMLLTHWNGNIVICDMLTSDFLILKQFNPEQLSFETALIQPSKPMQHKWVGAIYESLFVFVAENDQGQKENNILIDISQNPPRFYKTAAYSQMFHNTYFAQDLIFSKFGATKLEEQISQFNFDYFEWKIRLEMNKALNQCDAMVQTRQEIAYLKEQNEQQQNQINVLRQELGDCKFILKKLMETIKNTDDQQQGGISRTLSMAVGQVINETQQQMHGGGIGAPEGNEQ